MDGRQGFLLLGLWLALGACGCSQHDPAPFPDFVPPASSILISGPNAYDDYLEAAKEVDQELGTRSEETLTRTSYTAGQRAELSKLISPAIADLRKGVDMVCRLPFDDERDRPPPYRLEWEALGRVLRWQVEDDCAAGSFDQAIAACSLGSKFGFDLTSGGPEDASLGFSILDGVRQKIAPFLLQMGAGQLGSLSKQMKGIYEGRPPIDLCLNRVGRDMLLSVQQVQTCYQKDDYAWLQSMLALDAKEPILYLRGLHQQSDKRRAEFFDGFAAEARLDGAELLADGAKPLALRSKGAPPKGDRPWRRLARHFFGEGEPVLAMNDEAAARTRLLILETQILRLLKVEGHTPPDLSHFSRDLTVDPYSGDLFVYRTDGREYRLYSVGSDLVDNQGDTDETYTRPDLTLEHPEF